MICHEGPHFEIEIRSPGRGFVNESVALKFRGTLIEKFNSMDAVNLVSPRRHWDGTAVRRNSHNASVNLEDLLGDCKVRCARIIEEYRDTFKLHKMGREHRPQPETSSPVSASTAKVPGNHIAGSAKTFRYPAESVPSRKRSIQEDSETQRCWMMVRKKRRRH